LDSTAAAAASAALAAASAAASAATNAANAAVAATAAATAALSATNTLLKPTDTLSKVSVVDTITNPVTITGITNPAKITYSDSANLDAFGRLRVSEPTGLFDEQCQYNAASLRMESVITGAGVAAAFNANTRLVALQVNTGGAGGSSLIQSFQYIPYQPGKSQLIKMTGVLGSATAGAVKRFGYGDANNGIFYEQNGTSGLQITRRTSTSGAPVDNTVVQASWNIDHFDGSGPSGVTINAANCFILVIDLQFLSMGRVRVGFDVGGVTYYAHQFLNANVLTVPYMQTATLPVLAEVRAASALAAIGTAQFKCAAVVSEGGFQLDTGRNFSTNSSVTAASGARTHVLSLRPSITFNGITNRGLFILENIELISGLNAVLWELVIGSAFSVAPTFSAVNSTYSFIDAGTGGTFLNLTTGIVIASGFIASNGTNHISVSKDINVSYPITLDRSGAVRPLGTISLLLTGLAGTSVSQVIMNWREVR
jgi:hypothetical protein